MAEEHQEQARSVEAAEEEVAARLARERGETRAPAEAEKEPDAALTQAPEEEDSALARGQPDGEQGDEALARPRPDGELETRDRIEPDVLLHVPTLKVEEISVEVDELEARVALHAEVANLVKLDVGADVSVGRVKIAIKGVEAAALLKVRLDEVYKILERTLTTIDNNPQLLESLLKPVGEAVGEVGKGARETLPEVGKGVGETLPEVGKGVGETLPEVGKGVREAVPEVGKGVGEAGAQLGRGVGEAGGEVGKSVGQAAGEVGKGVGETGREVGKGVGQVGQAAGETAGQVGQAAGEAAGQVGQAGGETVKGAAPAAGQAAGPAREAIGKVEAGSHAVERAAGEAGEGAQSVEPSEGLQPESGGQANNESLEERGKLVGEKGTPVFDKLRDDLVKVAQDIGELVKEGLGEPGGKGILGQLSRLSEAVQAWAQDQEGKKQAEAAGGEAKEKAEEAKPEAEAKEAEEKPEAEAKEGEEKPEAEEKEGEEKPEAVRLFEGNEESVERWNLVGSGNTEFKEGEFCLEAGDDIGLAYYEQGKLDDGVFRLKFRPETSEFDACVAVRFRNPSEAVPDRENPETKYNYDNPAYVAVHTGFAVQLSNRPGAVPGTFEGVLIGDAPGAQLHQESASIQSDDWNELEVEYEGNCFAVRLNGKQTARFANVDSYRAKSSEDDPSSGFVGILARQGRLRMKEIEFLPREAAPAEAEAAPAGEETGQEERQ